MHQIKDIADVYYQNIQTATLWKRGATYCFQYLEKYLARENAVAVAYTLPLQRAEYSSARFFPFFEGLVAEGWLLAGQAQAQKIDESDTFRLLIENGADLVGAVTVIRREKK